MLVLKIVKKTTFSTQKATGTFYVVAYKGRVFGVSTLAFEQGDLVENGDVLTIQCAVERVKQASDFEGKSLTVLKPKLDIELGDE